MILEKVRCTRIGWAWHCWKGKRRDKKAMAEWERGGRVGSPPGSYKRRVILDSAEQNGISVMVETGTYMGDTVQAVKGVMSVVYSIELDEHLSVQAKQRFARDSNVKILQGDSSKLLPSVIREIQGPALFWLDGHYSGGCTAKGEMCTPIIQELKVIGLRSTQDVILVDDARLFTGTDDYPTIDEVRKLIRELFPGSSFVVKEDIIRVVTKHSRT